MLLTNDPYRHPQPFYGVTYQNHNTQPFSVWLCLDTLQAIIKPGMATSIRSDVFAFLAIPTISLAVLLLLRHFLPLRTTPAYLLLPIFLALALPVSIILLVPIDLASSLRATDEASRGIWLPDRVILVAWRLTYWLTFALTW